MAATTHLFFDEKPTTKQAFETLGRALDSNNIEGIKKILHRNFDVDASAEFGRNCLMLACRFSSSPEAINLVFESIVEAGGDKLLRSQFSSTDKDGWSALMIGFIYCSSREVMKLVLEKIVEVAGADQLNKILAATDRSGRNCLMHGCSNASTVKLLTVVLFCFDHFKHQYESLNSNQKKTLKEKTGIDSSSWTPNPESLAEVQLVLEEENFLNVVHSNNYEHSKMKELLKNNNESAKKILDSKLNVIAQLCFYPKTPHETLKLLFSYIKRICGNQYLKELLSKENDAGENILLSLCLRHASSARFRLLLDTIEEVGGEEFLVEQIFKKRQSDGMTCFFALCQFARDYDIFSLFVSKIFETESLGRRFFRDELNSNPCLESIFGRLLDSLYEKKILFLIVNLCSMTGLFQEQHSRLDEEKKEILRRICNIESGKWCRAQANDSPFGDLIGDIKKSINQSQ